MRTLQMFEQADTGRNGFIYSWILDAPYAMRSRLSGWKWLRGAGCRGCYVTNDEQLASNTAKLAKLVIRTNNTHATFGAPFKLAVP